MSNKLMAEWNTNAGRIFQYMNVTIRNTLFMTWFCNNHTFLHEGKSAFIAIQQWGGYC